MSGYEYKWNSIGVLNSEQIALLGWNFSSVPLKIGEQTGGLEIFQRWTDEFELYKDRDLKIFRLK